MPASLTRAREGRRAASALWQRRMAPGVGTAVGIRNKALGKAPAAALLAHGQPAAAIIASCCSEAAVPVLSLILARDELLTASSGLVSRCELG